jgi:hypothetical protein
LELLLTLLRRHGVRALAILREERGSLRVGGLRETAGRLREATGSLLEASTSRRTVLAPLQIMSALFKVARVLSSTYAALQGTTVDLVAVELADGVCSILVGVHLNESKATVRLEASLGNISEVLEKRNKVVLGSVRGQVANVAGGLPRGSLLDNHLVGVRALGGEAVVTERSGRGHAHLGHGLLLRVRRLALLVGPVAADGARTEPLAVHVGQSLFGIATVTESDETVATRATSLHVPHNAGLGHGAKGGESLEKDLIVDFVGEIADKDVEVVRGVLLGDGVRLVSPVDANLLLVDATAVESLHRALGGTRVVVLNKTVVEALGLELEEIECQRKCFVTRS